MTQRTLKGAAAIMGGRDGRAVERLSSKWSWRIRAELWDAKVSADALVPSGAIVQLHGHSAGG